MTPHVLLETCLEKMLKIHSFLLKRQVCFSSIKKLILYQNNMCRCLTASFDYYNATVQNLEIIYFRIFCVFHFLTFTFCLYLC